MVIFNTIGYRKEVRVLTNKRKEGECALCSVFLPGRTMSTFSSPGIMRKKLIWMSSGIVFEIPLGYTR